MKATTKPVEYKKFSPKKLHELVRLWEEDNLFTCSSGRYFTVPSIDKVITLYRDGGAYTTYDIEPKESEWISVFTCDNINPLN